MPSDLLFSPSWKFSLGNKITVEVGGNSKGTLKVRPAGQGGLALWGPCGQSSHAGCYPSLSLPLGSGPCFWVSVVPSPAHPGSPVPYPQHPDPGPMPLSFPFVSSAAGTPLYPEARCPLELSAASLRWPG